MLLSVVAGCSGDGSPIKQKGEGRERGGCVCFWLKDARSWRAVVAMAGVFDIDLDQPDEKVSDDELEDAVSLR